MNPPGDRGRGSHVAVQKNSRVQKRSSPAGQESEESSSCASSRSSSWRSWRSGIPEEGPRGWWGGGGELPGEVVGILGTESVSWSTKPHQIDFLRKRSLG
ncbi:unnamed protein product [Rangifer tarandus platyrhynchus]|uniref:Uncharacterized protein n=1 Tax=Rangifer tarandus platyrhynchus TaxID=3082113 RepID=A0AC59ZCD8_RANTA